MDFERCKKVFDKYVAAYDKKEKGIDLKYHHSYAVSDLMAELAFRLNLSEEEIILAKIIGLLHDIGRFEQLKKYHSYSDKNVDHADKSCHYLFGEGHIRDFLEESSYDNIIEKAIQYHNKYSIPKMEEKESLFSKMIRDMDKVDIFKQVAIHYPLSFDANEVSKEVLSDFQKEQPLHKMEDLNKSDALIVDLALLFDINFDESFDILVETDNFDLFLSMVEVAPNSEKLWKKIREVCFDWINQGTKKEEQK